MRKNEGIKGRGNDWTHISENEPIKQFSLGWNPWNYFAIPTPDLSQVKIWTWLCPVICEFGH